MKIDFEFISSILKERKRVSFEDSSLIQAAVLLPVFIKKETPNILFTKRTDKVEHHKGEISFPGGMKSDEDKDLIETALRETSEEIGVEAEKIKILGSLDDMPTVTGFKITPFVGVLSLPLKMKINEEEIERIIEVPLPLLMQDAMWSETLREYRGDMLKTYFFNYNGDIIWGATAGILKNFIDILKEHSSRIERE
ncbi:MAG: CoA pyrophosphatase [Candidatus Schekmanbacteria bacterium]|nr:MAG: CoA pyrophosphatase [Candidatus Schekmanbacteria bacterium]